LMDEMDEMDEMDGMDEIDWMDSVDELAALRRGVRSPRRTVWIGAIPKRPAWKPGATFGFSSVRCSETRPARRPDATIRFPKV